MLNHSVIYEYLQFYRYGRVERWLEDLWTWMLRFKNAVVAILLEVHAAFALVCFEALLVVIHYRSLLSLHRQNVCQPLVKFLSGHFLVKT